MRTTIDKRAWLRQVAVAILYFAGYTVLRDMSFSHWVLPAGLRLLCLMFLPVRYWPALVLGELLGLAKVSYDCYDVAGPNFAVLNFFAPIFLAIPIVHACRTRLALFDAQRHVHIGILLLCTLLLSLATAARDFSLMFITSLLNGPAQSGGDGPVTLEWAQDYFLGNYLGILTVVPLALMLWEASRGLSWQALRARLANSRLAMDSAALLAPALILLMWIAATHAKGDTGQIARIAMFLPVAALAMRHGWRGAAIGGSAASVAIALVMPALYDPATMQAQVFMSFAITTSLMLGARIAMLDEQKQRERIEGRLALQVAQQGLYLSELRMQHAAATIEQIGDSIYSAHERILGHLRAFMPAMEEKSLVRQGIVAQHEVFRLADGIYPRALSENGLSHVLRLGSITHAFDSVDVAYSGQVTGADLFALASGTQLAVYRLACESAVYLYEQATLSTVHLRVRSGVTKGQRWVALRMESMHAPETLDLMPSRMACEQFANRLGTSRQGIDALHDLVRVYSGMVHVRSTAQGTRLALLLHDAVGVPGRVN